MKERIDSERNQGRAPDMGWLDHDRLGFNYRLSATSPARSGSRSSSGSTACWTARARVAGAYREALAGRRGARASRARTRAATAAAGSCSSSSCRAACDRDDVIRALRARGIQSKPYLPAIHLMSFYRERFGHREGEFPVCEDVAARSIALPFFPRDERGPGRAGGGELRAVLERRIDSPPHVALRRAAGPGLRALNASIGFDRRLWPHDVAQSRAHARMLAARGSSPAHDRDALLAGLDAVEAELRTGTFPFARTTRTSTWRSSGA